MYNISENDREELDKIIARAIVDPEFRQELLENPHDAIKEQTGIELSSKFKIQFIEQPKELDAYVILPKPVTPVNELSDNELEAVAGGEGDTDGSDGVCWNTCKTTCQTSCDTTCDVTGTKVTVVPELL